MELQKEQEVSKEVEKAHRQLQEREEELARRQLQEREAEEARKQLQEREAGMVRQVETLRRENAELRSASSRQEQRLAECQREAEESRAELAGLEAILGLLHLQEVCHHCALHPLTLQPQRHMTAVLRSVSRTRSCLR